MARTAELRVGIVGHRGQAFIPGLRSMPEVHVAAFCDTNPATLQTVADRHSIPTRYVDFDEMIEADLDAVIVATPMHLHVPQSVAALSKGKHVMSEVTAGVSVDECRQLVEAVRRSGRGYMMAENYCYSRPNMTVQRMAAEGLFGDLYYAEGAYIHDVRSVHQDAQGQPTWRTVWQVGRNGCTYGTHSLGPVLQWLGGRVATVSCMGTGQRTEPRHAIDDRVVMLCQTADGGLIDIRLDMLSPRPHNMTHYVLQGTKGAYEAARRPGEPNLVWIEGRSPGREVWQDLEEYAEAFCPEPWRLWGEQARAAGHGGGDFFVVRDFLRSVLDGTTPPIDVYRALDFTLPGLVSEQSIARGGVPLPVPDPREW
jgi:predicted dehydrogenase